MKKAYLMTGTLIVAMGAASLAMAHGGKERGGERGQMRGAAMFEAMDTNGDGKLTQAEIDAYKAKRFSEADADGDGFLSPEEMAAQGEKKNDERRAKRATRMIERLDANEDGKLSAEELDARGPGNLIEKADKDGDGAVTLEELREARMDMRDKRGKGWKKRGDN
ncbi:EF-hand domain-containing protein [Thalassococcus lentus]|uniref:EF-hand domain-containing protein n=1 Tax=Thalassococcus lentus TaxID=1210524 RepID=A0ABT4XWN3_9RHOB|nr:EF-hand domain-containing protein [Thalassococcus lentus]MDA7426383.1 EF-hand domain-containing protein [Thalassococcus lentus]